MLRKLVTTACVAALLAALPAAAKPKAVKPSKDLHIVAVDVEGGSATLFVTPEGKSLLIDSGWPPGVGGPRPVPGQPAPPPGASSADKIVAAANALGVKKLDYFIITHYHVDHLGGLKSLLEKMPIDTFIDHGPNQQPTAPNTPPERMAFASQTLYDQYQQMIAGHHHIVPKTGDTLDIGSMHLTFVSVNGQVLTQPLPGAGQPNPDCAGVPQMARDGGAENAFSVSTLVFFGKTRIAQFGDLSWNKEIELLCPVNRVGKLDVYFVTQHGMDLSSSPPTRALDPLVSIMGSGATKGGDEAPLKMIASYPHGQDLWKVHYSVRYPDLNGDPNLIANLNWVPDLNFTISVDVTPDGTITVVNGRNNFSKTYKSRAASGQG